eukprot:263394-Chlamydomonas_euryale.AAC.1
MDRGVIVIVGKRLLSMDRAVIVIVGKRLLSRQPARRPGRAWLSTPCQRMRQSHGVRPSERNCQPCRSHV